MRARIEKLERIVKSSLPCSCAGDGSITLREYAADEAPPGEPCDPGRCELCGRPRSIKFIEVRLVGGENG